MTRILITGCAGFIGMHTALELLKRNCNVLGLDNFSDYYDPELKRVRLNHLQDLPHFDFIRADINDKNQMDEIFTHFQPDKVVHLAAQPGVRYSLINPHAYFLTNQMGFGNVIEASRKASVRHFVYASSSSVYGIGQAVPFQEDQGILNPMSLYAASKISNEMVAYSFSYNFKLPTTGLRFFTVYGPWGRPDMAPSIFAHAIYQNQTIKLNNFGNMKRDFTYIDDIINGIIGILIDGEPDFIDGTPYSIYNVGNNSSVELRYFLELLESLIGKKAHVDLSPLPNGDMVETFANIDKLKQKINFQPSTTIEKGLEKFMIWFKDHYRYPI